MLTLQVPLPIPWLSYTRQPILPLLICWLYWLAYSLTSHTLTILASISPIILCTGNTGQPIPLLPTPWLLWPVYPPTSHTLTTLTNLSPPPFHALTIMASISCHLSCPNYIGQPIPPPPHFLCPDYTGQPILPLLMPWLHWPAYPPPTSHIYWLAYPPTSHALTILASLFYFSYLDYASQLILPLFIPWLYWPAYPSHVSYILSTSQIPMEWWVLQTWIGLCRPSRYTILHLFRNYSGLCRPFAVMDWCV